MRVAFILNKFPALSQTFVLNQIVGLIERGHELDIYADGPGNVSKLHDDVTTYHLMERTYYYNAHRTMPQDKLQRIARAARQVAHSSNRRPLTALRALNIVRFGKQAASLATLYHVLPFLNKAPYDIVHCHFGTMGLWGLRLKELGAVEGKLVTTFYGRDASAFIKSRNAVYNELFSKGDLCIHISDYLKSKLLPIGYNESKAALLRLGVDLQAFTYAPRSPDADGQVRVLSVGRLTEKKGMEYTIRAVARLADRRPGLHYTIVGDGELRNQLQSLIDQLGVGAAISLVGGKSQDEVRQLYKQAHIFVLASVTAANGDEEGQGLVLQEAQAMGLPVVCTTHNGFPEGVRDGESALMVPERDVDALAERLDYLIAHPELWPAMGLAGRQHVEAHFDRDKLNDRLVQIYERLLSGQPQDSPSHTISN